VEQGGIEDLLSFGQTVAKTENYSNDILGGNFG